MKPNTPAWIDKCLIALDSAEPVTPADIEEHKRLIAAEMARAEQRRNPQPQPELPL